MITGPYGSWVSPVSPEHLTTAALRLGAGIIEQGVRYWTEGHPEEGGRVGLWRQLPGAPAVELTGPQVNVRTAVNEYGGGDWTARDALVAYCSAPDGAVWLIEGDSAARRLAAVDGCRHAALSLAPDHRLLLAVREDHRGTGEPTQTVVALSLDADNPDGGRVLAAGADFYAHPSLNAEGQLAWCQWNHPNMPWDQASVFVASLDDPSQPTAVADRAGVSALYPTWALDGALIYLSDAGGFWNFQRWDDQGSRELLPAPHDFCGPLWVLTPAPYTVIDATRLGCTWLVDGLAHLGVLDFSAEPRLEEFECSAVSAVPAGRGERCLALLGFADRPSELVEWDWSAGTWMTVRRAGDPGSRRAGRLGGPAAQLGTPPTALCTAGSTRRPAASSPRPPASCHRSRCGRTVARQPSPARSSAWPSSSGPPAGSAFST